MSGCRTSWLAAAGGHGLTGAIGFYGRPGEGRDGTPGPAQRASELEAPILALQAGADQHINTASVTAAMREAKFMKRPPSAHFPKFVIPSCTHFHELRKVMGTSKPMILVPLSI